MFGIFQRLRARHATAKPGSDRNFGYVFAAFFTIVALWPLWSGARPNVWALLAAALFLLVALIYPRALRPLNVVWFYFGLVLNEIMNPVIMGFIFAIAFVPMGVVMRLMGKDLLDLRKQAEAKTYWTIRSSRSITPQSMRDQF